MSRSNPNAPKRLALISSKGTLDVFGFKKEDFIKEAEIGRAATFLEYAADADVQLFI